ncbi:hypothetical protein JJQ72_09575 [Paenibacillus sp. F411]|uniref:Uncharacterized protein n=1 Tax=Paenibacillus algicola TaxID=2565926 RepID=A0A4P8XRG0_9BACL|nr:MULTISPECIES: hypothetical protein [Paenibacillus]MBO2944216.1 hypothetical protein [Paenibacillus sp. F411]QCT03069.1 hypothetical protein E6C60_2357 [Paenibacillus algicola]
MAFGITRQELRAWQQQTAAGVISFLTHYWYDPRFPQFTTVTKVGCSDLNRLAEWCLAHDLDPAYIHRRMPYPHFDLIGPRQREILRQAGQEDQLHRFKLD